MLALTSYITYDIISTFRNGADGLTAPADPQKKALGHQVTVVVSKYINGYELGWL